MSNIWTYNDFLPLVPAASQITLGEAQTPLVKSRSVGRLLGLSNLYFKLENLNPTGSYKDRFASVLISLLSASGESLCICTSSGNTGAALAAYAAAADIKCFVAAVEGAPLPKIRQMQLYGATVCSIKGFGRLPSVTGDVFDTLKKFCAARSLPLPISAYCYCSEGMEGVQTIAYEILDESKGQCKHIFCPAGGGGLTLAVAKGVIAYRNKNLVAQTPSVHCVQPEGNNTIAGPLREHRTNAQAVAFSDTQISGLQVASVLDGDEVIKACSSLGGTGFVVKDAEVFACQKMLAQREGIFCEPAGAVALAGAIQALRNKEISGDDHVVCLVTGSGFKDMHSVETNFELPQAGNIDNIMDLARELSQL